MSTTAYHPLTEHEAKQYALLHLNVFPQGAVLHSREIGDGNLNLVFHISHPESGRSIIMKQALPYAKVVGESWPLTLDRARIEYEALKVQEELCPGLVPRLYGYDGRLALTIMEDLSDHVIMRTGLISGGRYPLFAEHISTFLARTLFFTSDLGMNQQEKKLRMGSFVNPELCKITEDLIFDHPYRDADTNNYDPSIRDAVEAIWSDKELHLEIALLREGFLTKSQALLHGDLHTGSIFVTEQSTKVIDPEFAFYGPMGFDIGAVIANLLLNSAAQEGWSTTDEERRSRRELLMQTIQDVWDGFAAKFDSLWETSLIDPMASAPGYKELYMERLLQDTMGYAGCKMIRRVIGLAHVADIDRIEDPSARERARRLALSVGTRLVKGHRKASRFSDFAEAIRG